MCLPALQASDFSEVLFSAQTSHLSSLAARIAILFAPTIREARQSNSFAGMSQILVNAHDRQPHRIGYLFKNFCLFNKWFLGELITGYGCTCQVHFNIFGRIGLMPSDCIALHSLDQRLSPKRVRANEMNSDMRS